MTRSAICVLMSVFLLFLLAGCGYEDPVPVNDTPGHMFPLDDIDTRLAAEFYDGRGA